MGDNTSDRDDPKSGKHPDDPANHQPDGNEPESQRPMSIRIKQTAPNAVGVQTEPHKKQRDTLDWLNFVILVAAMSAAIFAAVYTGQEVRVAKKTLKVAGDTLKEVREGTRKELRAYVSAFPYHHVNGVAAGTSPHTAAMIKNTGQTPAWDVSFKAKLVAKNEPPEPTMNNFIDLPSRKADTYLAPTVEVGAADIFYMDRQLTVEDFEAVKTGESMRFYAWGVAAYTDVFGKPHHSYFCFIYFGYGKSPDGGMGSKFRDFCPHPRND